MFRNNEHSRSALQQLLFPVFLFCFVSFSQAVVNQLLYTPYLQPGLCTPSRERAAEVS